MQSQIDFDDDYILIDHKQNVDKILDKIYLGSHRGALDKKYLDELGVKQILVCGDDLRLFFPSKFNYKVIAIKDDPDDDILKYFKESIEFLDNGESTFVHCKRGVSRSASIVIAYVMWKEKMKFREALEYVKSKRSVICPNRGFVKQLEEFQRKLLEEKFCLGKDEEG